MFAMLLLHSNLNIVQVSVDKEWYFSISIKLFEDISGTTLGLKIWSVVFLLIRIIK